MGCSIFSCKRSSKKSSKQKESTYVETAADVLEAGLKRGLVRRNSRGIRIDVEKSKAAEIIDSSYSNLSLSIEIEDDSALEDNPIWFDQISDQSSSHNEDLSLLLKSVDEDGNKIRIRSSAEFGRKRRVHSHKYAVN